MMIEQSTPHQSLLQITSLLALLAVQDRVQLEPSISFLFPEIESIDEVVVPLDDQLLFEISERGDLF